MPQWTDSRIELSVTEELKDLQEVLAVVSQLSTPVALRILDYCASYVKHGASVPPMLEKEALATLLGKMGTPKS